MSTVNNIIKLSNYGLFINKIHNFASARKKLKSARYEVYFADIAKKLKRKFLHYTAQKSVSISSTVLLIKKEKNIQK